MITGSRLEGRYQPHTVSPARPDELVEGASAALGRALAGVVRVAAEDIRVRD